MSGSSQKFSEIVGLLPAAGRATRLSPIPCSKKLFPVGFRPAYQTSGLRPEPVCLYLLEKMRLAGVKKAFIILREGKWNIPAYLRDSAMLDMAFAYLLMMGIPFSPPFTLDHAYPFVNQALIAFGFPDILFEPDDAFIRLLDMQRTTAADVVLGLLPADRPETVDMLGVDEQGLVKQFIIKPRHTALQDTWAPAIWTPVFTRFMHEYVADLRVQGPIALRRRGHSGARDPGGSQEGTPYLGCPISPGFLPGHWHTEQSAQGDASHDPLGKPGIGTKDRSEPCWREWCNKYQGSSKFPRYGHRKFPTQVEVVDDASSTRTKRL